MTAIPKQDLVLAKLAIDEVYKQKASLPREGVEKVASFLQKNPELLQDPQVSAEVIELADIALSTENSVAPLVHTVCSHLIKQWSEQQEPLDQWLRHQHILGGIAAKVASCSLDAEKSLFIQNNTLFVSHVEFETTDPKLLWPKLLSQLQSHGELNSFAIQGTKSHFSSELIQSICEIDTGIDPKPFLQTVHVKCGSELFQANLGVLQLLFKESIIRLEDLQNHDTQNFDIEGSHELVFLALQWTETQNPESIRDKTADLLVLSLKYNWSRLIDACCHAIMQHIEHAPRDHENINIFMGLLAEIDRRGYTLPEITQQLLDLLCPILEDAHVDDVDLLAPWRAFVATNQWQRQEIIEALEKGLSNIIRDILAEDSSDETIEVCRQILLTSQAQNIDLSELNLNDIQLQALLTGTFVR